MSKKAKLAARVKRRAAKRSAKESKKTEWLAKINSGNNTKTQAKRLQRHAKQKRLVADTKNRDKTNYVPPSKYFKEFWARDTYNNAW